jgi:iron complex transport system ATP-binding protein
MQGTTVRELVALGRTPHQKTGWVLSRKDKEKVDWALEYLQLVPLQHRLLDTLSGGERQRAWIAMALAQDTPLLLLDEPVTYMDLKHQWELLEIIIGLKEYFSKTIISVFHDINHALEVADRICLMHQGAVHRLGSPVSVITEETLRQVYGIHAHVCQVEPGWRPVVIPEGLYCRRAKRRSEHQTIRRPA